MKREAKEVEWVDRGIPEACWEHEPDGLVGSHPM
jgi:hypothetical protein